MLRACFAVLTGFTVLVSCSLTDPDPAPAMVGPVEIVGVWKDYQIVCTVPLTIQTPFPILVKSGALRMVFPAEGEPKAAIQRDFTPHEIGTLWGAGVERSVTRSLEINPLVQFEDYETTVTFSYAGARGPGTMTHAFRCVAEPGSTPDA